MLIEFVAPLALVRGVAALEVELWPRLDARSESREASREESEMLIKQRVGSWTMLGIAWGVFVIAGVPSAEAQPAPAKEEFFPIVPTAWDISNVEDPYRPAFTAWKEKKFKEAEDYCSELARNKTDHQLRGDDMKKAKYLEMVAEDLADNQKLFAAKMNKSRFHPKTLMSLQAASFKYRDTFAYFIFAERERKYRQQFVRTISDFEPPPETFPPHSDPIDPFKRYQWGAQLNLNGGSFSNVTTDARQGQFAFRYEVTPQTRGVAPIIDVKHKDWDSYNTLCLTAKLDNPDQALMELYIFASPTRANYFKIGLGSWKGWKTHRIKFKKRGKLNKRLGNRPLSWKTVEVIQVATAGAESSFTIDDIYIY